MDERRYYVVRKSLYYYLESRYKLSLRDYYDVDVCVILSHYWLFSRDWETTEDYVRGNNYS